MIVHLVFNFFGGGAISGRARQEVAALLKAGHKVAVITDAVRGPNPFEHEAKNPLTTVVTPASSRFDHMTAWTEELSFAFRCHRELKRLARLHTIKLVVFHGGTLGYPAVHFSRKNTATSVYVIQALIRDRLISGANPYSWSMTCMYLHACRYAASKSNRCVAISSHMKKMAVAEGARPENVVILPNPVDTAVFNSDGADVKKEVDVLYVGRFSVEKGIDVLLKAAKELPRETRILIIGQGPMRRQLEEQARRLSCRVEFKDWLKNEELPGQIRKAKVQVVPSLSEPQGLVVLEALACGVPVIGSDTGGIPDMIQHEKNGWLVPPNDVASLARTLKTVLGSQEKLEAAASMARTSVETFSLKRFSHDVVALYERLMR